MKKQTRKKSIRAMLLQPMLVVSFLILVIFTAVLVLSDFFSVMGNSEVADLEHKVTTKGVEVQRLFNDLSTITENMITGVQYDAYSIVSSRSDIGEEIRRSPEKAELLLEASVERVVDALKMNKATGAFVMLDTSVVSSGDGGIEGGKLAAIYLNDEDLSTIHPDNSDLMLFYGPKNVSRSLQIPLDNYWGVEYDLTDFTGADFIFKPFQAAKDYPLLREGQLLYWSSPVEKRDGQSVLLLTAPLMDAGHEPYGVAGVEVSLDYLKTFLTTGDLEYSENSFYALTELWGEGNGNWLVANGTFAMRNDIASIGDFFQNPLPRYGDAVYEFQFPAGDRAISVIMPLHLYRSGSPYGEDTWGLIGGMEKKTLFTHVERMKAFFLLASALAIAVGILSSVGVSGWLVSPIIRLRGQLAALDPEEKVKLDKTGIHEFDMLIESIEQLSDELLESGAKTEQAIAMTQMPIGFLEINSVKGRVYLSDRLFEMFGMEKRSGGNHISNREWEELRGHLEEQRDLGENIYVFRAPDGVQQRWVRFVTAEGAHRSFGVVVDVTADVLEKRRLEYERDTDPLTGLLNRGAFFKLSHAMVAENPNKLGVMLFSDLDNLKYVNDTYGHDVGDRYICAAAREFDKFSGSRCVVARISGDEFAALLYGYDSRKELEEQVENHCAALARTVFRLPDGNIIKVRSSMGYAWYPQDSTSLDTLLRYADFAMYEIKRSSKGSIREFDPVSYHENAYLVEKNEEFNLLIDNNRMNYVFQPIVDVRTGSIFGYEALMRPDASELKTPFQVLQMARNQAKLYEIERMTLFNVLSWVDQNLEKLAGRKVFFNSIPDQGLSAQDFTDLRIRFGHCFSHTVAEITESERGDWEQVENKLDSLRELGCDIAVDDFGSGYSNEFAVLSIQPDYVKIDISLVKDIHRNENKQKLVSNIIDYAGPRGIKIIVEGVECLEEAQMAVQLGVDYLQGYYLAVPSADVQELDDRIIETLTGAGQGDQGLPRYNL